MQLELERLEKREEAFAHAYQPEELVLDDEHVRLIEPPQINGRVERKGTQVRVRGQITARAEVDCDRCLKAIEIPVETAFDVTYVPSEDYKASEAAELQEDDLSVSVYDDGTIDVDDLVREQVLLAVPNRVLCGEECKGLCPVCGADRNASDCQCEKRETDPRWAALAILKPDQQDNQ